MQAVADPVIALHGGIEHVAQRLDFITQALHVRGTAAHFRQIALQRVDQLRSLLEIDLTGVVVFAHACSPLMLFSDIGLTYSSRQRSNWRRSRLVGRP